jgi:hypothetical protein
MRELLRYTDRIGRTVRLAVDEDADAWVRQELRNGTWWTGERHPMREIEDDDAASASESDRVPAGGD